MEKGKWTFVQMEPSKIVEITASGTLLFQGKLVETEKDIIEVLKFILENWKR